MAYLGRFQALVVLLAMLVSMSDAVAVSPLDEAQLRSSCQAYADKPDSLAATRCVLYVQGFLDGAVATDERVTMNVAQELSRNETLTERAIRTRLGDRVQLRGPTVYAEYCVGDPVPIQEIISNVVAELERQAPSQTGLARDVVYAALRRHYPCEE
jgi:hypothetical protein